MPKADQLEEDRGQHESDKTVAIWDMVWVIGKNLMSRTVKSLLFRGLVPLIGHGVNG